MRVLAIGDIHGCLDAISGRYWQTDLLGRKREGSVEYAEE